MASSERFPTLTKPRGAPGMFKTFRRRAISITAFVFVLAAYYSGNANAQVPTKIITVYNNSKNDTIYPMLDGFTGNVDLWMQAQFKDKVSDVNTQTFCNNSPVLFT